jgi:serine/threonine-protein kinase
VSPDNRWIAYSSNETGRREVYVRAFPDAGATKYQISNAGGINPQWNRNGRELFYLDATSNLVSVPVTTGTAFQAGTQRTLFSASKYAFNAFFPQYAVAPDGERFVLIRGESDAAVHAVVVFNFVEELKRRMAAP